MICEAILFLSAVYVYGLSVYQCFTGRNRNSNEEDEIDTEVTSKNYEIVSFDNMYIVIRVRMPIQDNDFVFTTEDVIVPLCEIREYTIPLHTIVSSYNYTNRSICRDKDKDPEYGSCCPSLNEDCPICMEPFQEVSGDIRTLPCKHSYCNKCIIEWLHKSLKCPLCNQHIVKTWFALKNNIYKEF